ncbi:MAG: hypothetical protein FWF77_01290 [Defluviitaleaceae bacterium]|nr:hypothetical protein [Defluviitaleaceae bacterium]
MVAPDIDVANAVQTELKIYMTQQLHRKGYLSDEMCAASIGIILKEAKLTKAKKSEVGCCHAEPLVV